MSFDDLEGGGRPPPRRTGYTPGRGGDGDSEYIRLSQKIGDAIGELLTNVGEISDGVSALGSPRDTQRLRDRLTDLTEKTKQMAMETARDIKSIGLLDGGSQQEKRQRKLQQQKLTKDFEAALNSFKEVERMKMQKEKSYVAKARAASVIASEAGRGGRGGRGGAAGGGRGGGAGGRGAGQEAPRSALTLIPYDEDDEDDKLMQQQQLRLQEVDQLDAEVNFNEALIEEREADIRQIETTIGEVNEIFRDLSSMVHEQGEMLEQMDNNIEMSVGHTTEAVIELKAANEYSKATRTKIFCLLGCAVAIGIIVVLAITLGVKDGV